MPTMLPQFRVGDSISHGGLTVFPLFAAPTRQVEYRLAEEALRQGDITVEEVSEEGSVPDLLVDNRGDSRVLFLEGLELIGAKQNRILNTTVLVAGRTKARVPVSCVERGRWRYSKRTFQPSGSYAHAKLRHHLKASVAQSIKEERGHRADQGAVWQEVDELHAACGVTSETSAMSDTFETYEDQLAEYRAQLKFVAGATGLAVAMGDRVVDVDFFDKPATCEQVWDRLLSGMVLDALSATQAGRPVKGTEVERLLTAAGDFPWEQVNAAGEGEEYRAESEQGVHASALQLEGVVVHGSLLCR